MSAPATHEAPFCGVTSAIASGARSHDYGRGIGPTPRSWIALGDSFTAGTGDDPARGGWARRAGDELRTAGVLDVAVNHAEPGVAIQHVIDHQLPLLAGRHWCVSVIAGANDLLAPRCDARVLAERVDVLLDACLDHAEVLLTSTCPDFFAQRSTRLARLSARVDALNDHVRRRAAADPRIEVIDAHARLADPALWSDDGLHPDPDGHAALAELACAALAARASG